MKLYEVPSPYFSLKSMCEFVIAKIDECVENAINYQDEGGYNISLSKFREGRGNTIWSDELFMEMLSERDEIAHIDYNYDDSEDNVFITLSEEYVKAPDKQYRELSENEMELMMAKHLLWVNHQGGERADFSGCLIKNCDWSRKKIEGANFDGAKFSNVNLSHATLTSSTFIGTTFLNCDGFMMAAEDADFSEATFAWSSFPHANMSVSIFRDAIINNCNLYNVDMSNSLLERIEIIDTDMRNVNTFNCETDDFEQSM